MPLRIALRLNVGDGTSTHVMLPRTRNEKSAVLEFATTTLNLDPPARRLFCVNGNEYLGKDVLLAKDDVLYVSRGEDFAQLSPAAGEVAHPTERVVASGPGHAACTAVDSTSMIIEVAAEQGAADAPPPTPDLTSTRLLLNKEQAREIHVFSEGNHCLLRALGVRDEALRCTRTEISQAVLSRRNLEFNGASLEKWVEAEDLNVEEWAFLRIHGCTMRPERSLATCGEREGAVMTWQRRVTLLARAQITRRSPKAARVVSAARARWQLASAWQMWLRVGCTPTTNMR